MPATERNPYLLEVKSTMSFVMQDNLNHLDDDSRANATRALYRLLIGLRGEVRKMQIDSEGMDIRLVSDERGALWVNTGDVSYDAHHGSACAAATVEVTSSRDGLMSMAKQLVSDVCDQLAEFAQEGK